MTVYGLYVCYLMLRRPEELAVEENHVSWAHMYRMMFVAQIGFALAYSCRAEWDRRTSVPQNPVGLDLANKKRNNGPLLFDLGPAGCSRPATSPASSRRAAPRRSPRPSAARIRPRYQEIRCRSALNRVKGMPFKWTLNPYRGCTHACHYCFARRYQTQLELGSGDEFSSVIFVKTNFVEVLRRELDHPRWTRETGRVRHRHRSVSADRRPLQAVARHARGARRRHGRRSASSPRGR